jgi:hypothetical protein
LSLGPASLDEHQQRDISTRSSLQRTDDLPRLFDIARHDCIPRYVESITFLKRIFGEHQQDHRAGDEHPNIQLLPELQEDTTLWNDDTRLLSISGLLPRFRKLKRLAVLDGRSAEQLEWEWSGHNLFSTRPLVHDDGITRQLTVLQDAAAHTSLHLDELCAEWLDTKFFLFKTAEISRIWKSLKVLRLGIVHDDESRGLGGLRHVLHELIHLEQLYLSCSGPRTTELDSIIDQPVSWNLLSHLSLRNIQAGEEALQMLLTLPSLKSISFSMITLEDDGCWIGIMERLQKHHLKQVCLKGWLANMAAGAWTGDSTEAGSLFQEVAEWLTRDDQTVGSEEKCPLTTENMDSLL